MAGWAIVAIPEKDDYVWKISSENVPHMTILFLGEPNETTDAAKIAEYLEHAVNTSVEKFGLGVSRRGTLGPEDADVVFFEDWNLRNLRNLRDFRSYLLKNDAISTMWNAVEQFPEWTPHLTLGYPDSPAREDDRDYPGVHYVHFDKIALWTGEFEGPEFDLMNNSDMEVRMTDPVERILAHYGVRGMRWGVRRNADGTTSRTGKRIKSEDHKEAEGLKKKRVSEMSNQELRRLNERMQLEQNYKQLMAKEGTTISKGQRYVKDALSVAKTGQEIYNLANSPAGKAVREVIEQSLKK